MSFPQGMLRDPDVSASIKNQYLKNAIERIDYERAPIVRITKKECRTIFYIRSQRIKISYGTIQDHY